MSTPPGYQPPPIVLGYQDGIRGRKPRTWHEYPGNKAARQMYLEAWDRGRREYEALYAPQRREDGND